MMNPVHHVILSGEDGEGSQRRGVRILRLFGVFAPQSDVRDSSRLPAWLLLLVLVGACNPDQAIHPKPQNDKSVDASSLSAQDRNFIEKAAQGNNAEVACGGLVDARSSNPAIIAFGHMMVADHGAANARLAEIARKHAISLPSSLGDQQAGYDRLVDRKGEDFDREFATVMVEDHNTARQLYQSELTSGTDPLLRQYAATMLQKIEAHLAQAKTLAPYNF